MVLGCGGYDDRALVGAGRLIRGEGGFHRDTLLLLVCNQRISDRRTVCFQAMSFALFLVDHWVFSWKYAAKLILIAAII